MALTKIQQQGIEQELERCGYSPHDPFYSIMKHRLTSIAEAGAQQEIPYEGGPWGAYAKKLRAALGPEP